MTTTLLPNIANQIIENKGRFAATADLGAVIQQTAEDKPFDNMVKAKAPEKAELPEKPQKTHGQSHAMALRAAKYTKPADQSANKADIPLEATKTDSKTDNKAEVTVTQKTDAPAPKVADNTPTAEKPEAPIEGDPKKVVVEVPNQVGYSVETLRNLLADGLQEADIAPLEQLQLNPAQDPALNPALAALQSLVKEILAQAEQGTLKLDPKLQAVFTQLSGAKTDSDVLQALNGIFKLFSARFQESNPGQSMKQFVAKLELTLPKDLLAKLADVPMLRAFAKKDVLTGQDLNRAMRTLVGLSLQDQTNAADYSLEALVPQLKPAPVVLTPAESTLQPSATDSVTAIETTPTLPANHTPPEPVAKAQAPQAAVPAQVEVEVPVHNQTKAETKPVIDRDTENENFIFERTNTSQPTTPSRSDASAKGKPSENRPNNVDNSTLKTLASAAKDSAFATSLDNNHPIAASKLESPATQSLKLSATQNALPSPATAQVAMYVQRAAGKVQQMTVQLNPAELGRVDIKMVAKPDGTTQVVLQVERPDTFIQLQKDTTHLEKMLQQAGLNTSAGDLSFQLKNQDQADQHAFGKQGQKQGSHNANGLIGTDIANETTEIDSSTLNLALGLRRVDYSA